MYVPARQAKVLDLHTMLLLNTSISDIHVYAVAVSSQPVNMNVIFINSIVPES